MQNFDHLIHDLEQALSDWEAGGTRVAHAHEDLRRTDKAHAAQDLAQ